MRLHPPTVHFPIAFWAIATMGDLLSYRIPALEQSVELAYLLGTGTALLAILSGLRDLSLFIDEEETSESSTRHLAWALVASTLYSGVTLLTLLGPDTDRMRLLATALSVFGLVALLFAGRTGGKLVHPY